MTWGDLFRDWHGQIDTLSNLFPHADPSALARFRGNRGLLAQYIADTHELTLEEGTEAVELRLLPSARSVAQQLVAAE
ncbi:hypothetical protein R3X27_19935 [Tropicimonas sp. TH_r6]|uniref:hypothetical protein n=1 Tax=Tropicimonas sp. TH_r6 TaxID=3082085 RepID=UPI0029554A9B|nr:hypothetical protein [Tropicimonas sp. TH_r6]MDV7144958.1 hypothetical protein [Tropicimonas sp. TH_r6]